MSGVFDAGRLRRVAELCDRYVDEGRVGCAQVLVAHGPDVVLRHSAGVADVDDARPLADDAIFRIYSMTKPITSLALMQQFERGRVLLEDPVERFIPEFADLQVWASGNAAAHETRPAVRKMTVRDVLTHTSGLTYGFFYAHPVDELYRQAGVGGVEPPEMTLEEGMARLGDLPLLFEPGSSWNYSLSTDVCGRIVEVLSERTLDDYFDEHILGPLGMVDTGFACPADRLDRLVSCYIRGEGGALVRVAANGPEHAVKPAFLSGGGGLVSTTNDYARLCAMLLAGGELDGERIIGRKTLEFMASNHLPGGRTLNEMGQSLFSETTMEGMGFGLGFSVVVDPATLGTLASTGEFAWGGLASTAFWIDPVENVSVVFMTQFMPSSYYPVRRELRATVYQALR